MTTGNLRNLKRELMVAAGFLFALVFWTLVANGVIAQSPTQSLAQTPAQNVVWITLDGLRGEEFFTGADQRLMIKELGADKPEQLVEKYWRESPIDRREILLPFLWSKINKQEAWAAGDFESDSEVLVTNGLYFSYPGYNEILCGFSDIRIASNDKKYNPNVTVLEWLANQDGFQGKIAAYGSWDVFPYIINDKRSGIPVNAGWQKLTTGDPAKIEALNLVADQLFHEWDGVRYDVLTVSGAIEELKSNQPRVLFVSMGETDDWAHAGRYDRYLLTAQQNDYFIKLLWETTQQLDSHRDNTLFIITTDHGRGDGREGWKSHGVLLPGSQRIWIAAFGAGLNTFGIDKGGRFEQSQVAATVAQALGYNYIASDSRIRPGLPILTEINTESGAGRQ